MAQERYLIAYAGFAGFQSPLWATKDLGLLTKYGINADLILTPGSTRQIQAMLGNSAHFAQVDAVTTINAIAQGADLVMISGSLNTFPFSFVAQKEIRKPEDLDRQEGRYCRFRRRQRVGGAAGAQRMEYAAQFGDDSAGRRRVAAIFGSGQKCSTPRCSLNRRLAKPSALA